LAAELSALGALHVAPAGGGVGFSGSFALCCRVNLESRLASRVLWQVATGAYRNEQEVYDLARAAPWADWFSPRSTIKVKVSAQDRALKSLDYVTLRIKDGVCDAFRAATGQRPRVETERPDVLVVAFLDGATATLYLDTSGDPLFKRGHRRAGGTAPIRENLAAGLLRLAGWPQPGALLDPLCGSGTILIEAAEMAAGLAPGRGRRFAFERLGWHDPRGWEAVKADREPGAHGEGSWDIFGSDVMGGAIEAARANLKAAGLDRLVRLEQRDVLTRSKPAEVGVIVTNPPYGVRVAAAPDMRAWYPKLGDALKRRFAGWRAYLLTADLHLPKLIGLSPSRRIPLFNGPLECRLYEFELVSGSMRGRSKKRPGASDRSDGSRPAV
jgi:putative N6-adenine-specific DNA methylase